MVQSPWAGSSSGSEPHGTASVSYSHSSGSGIHYTSGSGSGTYSCTESHSQSVSQQVQSQFSTYNGSTCGTTSGTGAASSSNACTDSRSSPWSQSSSDTYESEVDWTESGSTCSNDVAGHTTVGPASYSHTVDYPGFYSGAYNQAGAYLGDPWESGMPEGVVLPTYEIPTMPMPTPTGGMMVPVGPLPTGSLLGTRATEMSTFGEWYCPISGWWWLWDTCQTPRVGSIPRVETVLAGEGGSSQSYCMSSPGGGSERLSLGLAERQVLAPASSPTPSAAAAAVALSP